MQVILLGVDDNFVPPTKPRVPGRIIAMASADAPMKGIATLLEAFAKLRTERDLELLLVTKPQPGGRTEQLIDKLSIGDSVRFVSGVSDDELVELMGSAELACVPSLYEGFSLPTAELMACATPLVVSRAGAIPEVVGPDGLCADLVTPGDVGELTAAIAALLDDPARRDEMGRGGAPARGRAVQLARRGRGHRCGVRGGDRRLPARDRARPWPPRKTTVRTTRKSTVLTVDFDRLGLRPGDRVLDMGCGAGRHAFEMYRRGGDVIAFDQDADELSGVRDLFVAMKEAGEVPAGAEADVKEGDALALPFADGEFDRVVAAEVLEHIPADIQAIDELVRVLRPGGTLAVSVPRWFPEIINWKLSDDYHNAPGGHIRIYSDKELIGKLTNAGLEFEGKDYAHGLHSPYWWIKCAVGVKNDDHPLAQGVPPAAGLGDHEAAEGAPAGRPGARPADRQEPGALLQQARSARPMTDPARRGSRTSTASCAASRSPRPRPRSRRCRSRPAPIPWTTGEHADIWNHVEAAMALLVGGQVEAAERAYAWVPTLQRDDGSWPMKIVGGRRRGRPRRGQHVGVPRRRHLAPLADPARHRVRAPVLAVGPGRAWTGWCRMQLPFGGIAWSQEWVDGRPGHATRARCWRAPRASTSRCAPASRSPTCSTTRSRSGSSPAAGSGTRSASTATCSWTRRRSRWTGTTRSSAARSAATPAVALIETRWDDFVVPGLGIRCVDTNPWVTGAETCELAMALDALGDQRRALAAARATCSTCARRTGSYWTGWVYGDDVNWPVEHTTYTAAAVILAVDALGETHGHATGAPASCAAPRWRRTSRSWRWSAAARQATGSPASPRVRRSTRIDPSASTSVKAPLSSARRKTWYGGRPPSAGSGKTSWMTRLAAVRQPRRPARCSRSGRAPRRARRR